MRRLLLAFVLFGAAAASAAGSFDNDDSCDIAVMPAATLLLPYFEVDLDYFDSGGRTETTRFTITNVTNVDQIAHVTLWTDRSFPVFDFTIYLTGYDVQTIDLRDVIARGVVAPDAGTGTRLTKRGTYSDPNASLPLAACSLLPGNLDHAFVQRMQDAFTLGFVQDLGSTEGCGDIGGVHENAVGYATIDVVRTCTPRLPTEPEYWTQDIAYDNVLIGEYQQVNRLANRMQSGPLVHIRAIPEGGTARERRAHQGEWDAGFARTFYSRFQARTTPKLDGRQPLPSTFAARWIAGADGDYETTMKVWREGRTGVDAPCADYQTEESLAATELVAFDEHENAVCVSTGRTLRRGFPATSMTSVSRNDIYPQVANGARAGWMYFNLDVSRRDDFASQAWVIASMRAQNGRYSVDVDAAALGNGCAPPSAPTEITAASGAPLAPAETEESCDIAVLPAATLLLPYFEVDLDHPRGTTTLFTVTNVSPSDQIARVTLWTDQGFPAMSFHLVLTGYDVQSINLRDVILDGSIAPDAGAAVRGPHSDRNRAIDLGACSRGAITLSDEYIVRIQAAFTQGFVPDLGDLLGCAYVGNDHYDHAVGYATIDVVRNCDVNLPPSPEYWTGDLAHDNVLIGDYQELSAAGGHAQGNPMVHIRAMKGLDRTFYGRYQPRGTPALDRRQPLPSLFAARWRNFGSERPLTTMKIWREPGPEALTCFDRFMTEPPVTDIVRFDEAENAVGLIVYCRSFCSELLLPYTSRTSVGDSNVYPQLANGAIAGWMYINADDKARSPEARQAWVAVSIQSVDDGFATELDAAALGNGCSPPVGESEVTGRGRGGIIIGPAPNARPTP